MYLFLEKRSFYDIITFGYIILYFSLFLRCKTYVLKTTFQLACLTYFLLFLFYFIFKIIFDRTPCKQAKFQSKLVSIENRFKSTPKYLSIFHFIFSTYLSDSFLMVPYCTPTARRIPF